MWLSPLVTMLAIVVLGGLGSLKGSLIGAFIIGYVEAITVFAVPSGSYLKGAVALSIMVLVLLIRPEGLFGVVFEEERGRGFWPGRSGCGRSCGTRCWCCPVVPLCSSQPSRCCCCRWRTTILTCCVLSP